MTQLMLEIVGIWLAAILIGFPLFASMGLAAFAFVLLGGLSGSIVPQKMAQAMNSFPLVAAPLFILMGNFVARAGLAHELFHAAYAFIGHVRGGLAHATVLACAGFGAICGSSIATAATMAMVSSERRTSSRDTPT